MQISQRNITRVFAVSAFMLLSILTPQFQRDAFLVCAQRDGYVSNA